MSVRRGDIFYADLSPVVGSEQGGLRPVLIVQNDVGNKYSPTGYRRGDYKQDEQKSFAYTYRHICGQGRTTKRFGRLAGTDTYN